MSKARQVQIEQGSKEWLLYRRGKACASDIPALFTGPDGESLSPYKTMRDLFFENSGLVEPEDNFKKAYIYNKGHEAEAKIRALFIKHTKIPVKATCFEKGIFFCSLDGYYNSETLEAKLVGSEVLKQIARKEIPEHHRIQVNAQLYTSDSDKCYYGALSPNSKDGVVVEIGRDEKLIKKIVTKGEAFHEAILSGKIPPLSSRDTLFITDPKHLKTAARLSELDQELDKLNAEYDELIRLVKAMGNHTRVRVGNISVTEVVREGSIDFMKIPQVKKLAEEYLEKFRKKSSTYKTLKFRSEA